VNRTLILGLCASIVLSCTRSNPLGDGGKDAAIAPRDGGAPGDLAIVPGDLAIATRDLAVAPRDFATAARTDASRPSGSLVDPNCVDGLYGETLPNRPANLDDVVFNASDLVGFYLTVLDRRYPIGAAIVRGGRMNTGRGDCVALFADNPTTAGEAYASLDTVVHECGHLYDSLLSSGSTNVYYIRDGLTPSCSAGDTVARGGDTFERSRIRQDAYQPLRPACPRLTVSPTCDFYAELYLDGNPDDNTFQSGDQGYNFLLEEFVQYINSLATAWTFLDQRTSSARTTDRDGILTFIWYLERYLRMARLQYPTAYARIANDSCWRDAALNAWGRAWLYLEETKGITALGLYDSAIYPLATAPELLDEIARLRQLAGCH